MKEQTKVNCLLIFSNRYNKDWYYVEPSLFCGVPEACWYPDGMVRDSPRELRKFLEESKLRPTEREPDADHYQVVIEQTMDGDFGVTTAYLRFHPSQKSILCLADVFFRLVPLDLDMNVKLSKEGGYAGAFFLSR